MSVRFCLLRRAQIRDQIPQIQSSWFSPQSLAIGPAGLAGSDRRQQLSRSKRSGLPGRKKPSRWTRSCGVAVSCYSGGLWPKHIGVLPAYLVQRLGMHTKNLQAISHHRCGVAQPLRSRGATCTRMIRRFANVSGQLLDVAPLPFARTWPKRTHSITSTS